MALVNKLTKVSLEKSTPHQAVECTFSIVHEDGNTFLQIDTYGSAQRKIKGKKSQSIRFTKAAMQQLREILSSV